MAILDERDRKLMEERALCRPREAMVEMRSTGTVQVIHLRCANCGYGRMRHRWRLGLGIHCCDLCGYREHLESAYPRIATPREEIELAL